MPRVALLAPPVWNSRWIGLAQSSLHVDFSWRLTSATLTFHFALRPTKGFPLLLALGSPLHKSVHPSVHLFDFSSFQKLWVAIELTLARPGVNEVAPQCSRAAEFARCSAPHILISNPRTHCRAETFCLLLITNRFRVRRVKTRTANLVGRLGLCPMALDTSFVFEDPFIKPCYFGKIGRRTCLGATKLISKPNISLAWTRFRRAEVADTTACEDPSPRETSARKLLSQWPYRRFGLTKRRILPREDTRTREIPISKSYHLVGHPVPLPRRKSGYHPVRTLEPVRS